MRDEGSRQNSALLRRYWARYERMICGAVGGLILVYVWYLAGLYNFVDKMFISSPIGFITAAFKIFGEGELGFHLWISAQEFFIGFVLALVIGIIVGVLLGRYRLLGQLMDPMVMALNTTPRTALLPILILWVGVGMGSKIVIVFLGAVLPLIVNTMVGVRTTDKLLINIATSYGAKESDLLLRIMLPSAFPSILTGLRLAYGRGLLGVIIGEMYVSIAGVGNQIMAYGMACQVGELLVYVSISTIAGVVGITIIRKFEERIEAWRKT